MIFKDFYDQDKMKAQIIDATRSTGKVMLRIVDLKDLRNYGYCGYRMNK